MWIILEERMKAGHEHRVPLSDAAIAVLKHARGKHEEFVFPGTDDMNPMPKIVLLMLLLRMELDGITLTE